MLKPALPTPRLLSTLVVVLVVAALGTATSATIYTDYSLFDPRAHYLLFSVWMCIFILFVFVAAISKPKSDIEAPLIKLQ